MKRVNTFYWITNILFAGFMLFSAIPDIILSPEAVTFMKALGYPDYFTRFIGVAKALGCAAILLPISPRIKEWAYAGLAFDLIGAIYSIVSTHGISISIVFMLIPVILLVLAYYFHHKKLGSPGYQAST